MSLSPSETAKKLLIDYWDYSLPVNPIFFCNKIGIQVFSNNENGYDLENKKIYVRKDLASYVLREHIARSLYYILIGRNPDELNNDLQEKVLLDYDVHTFITELLIPDNALKILLFTSDVCSLTGKFDITNELLLRKLKRKNLLL